MKKVFIVAFLVTLVWVGFFIFFGGNCGNPVFGCSGYVLYTPIFIPIGFFFASGFFSSIKERPFKVALWSFLAALVALATATFVGSQPFAQKIIQDRAFAAIIVQHDIWMINPPPTQETKIDPSRPFVIEAAVRDGMTPTDGTLTATLTERHFEGEKSVYIVVGTTKLSPTNAPLFEGRRVFRGTMPAINTPSYQRSGELMIEGGGLKTWRFSIY